MEGDQVLDRERGSEEVSDDCYVRVRLDDEINAMHVDGAFNYNGIEEMGNTQCLSSLLRSRVFWLWTGMGWAGVILFEWGFWESWSSDDGRMERWSMDIDNTLLNIFA